MPKAILRTRDQKPIKEVELREFYIAPEVVHDVACGEYYIRVSPDNIHSPVLYDSATVEVLGEPKV